MIWDQEEYEQQLYWHQVDAANRNQNQGENMNHQSTEVTEQTLTIIKAFIVKAYRLGVNAARNNSSQFSPSSRQCGALAALKEAARDQGASSNLIDEAWRSGVIVAEKHQ